MKDPALIVLFVLGALILGVVFVTSFESPHPRLSAEPYPGPPAAVPTASLPSSYTRTSARPDGSGN